MTNYVLISRELYSGFKLATKHNIMVMGCCCVFVCMSFFWREGVGG